MRTQRRGILSYPISCAEVTATRCGWSSIAVLSAFLAGSFLGTALYRWVKGEADPGPLLVLLAGSLLLGVIALLARNLGAPEA